MSLAGFTSSQATPVTCSNYTFSGQYTNSDYLFKNYTGLSGNHYAVVVRFNVGYVGTWSMTDQLRLSLTDASGSVSFDYRYYCSSGAIDNITNLTLNDMAENINGEVGFNSTDCVRIKEYTIVHNSSWLALNFSALTTQSNPAVQFWGLKEILVASKDCHSYCTTCYGALNTQCLSCATGFYLQGNVCLPVCDFNLYVVPDVRMCVSQCPTRYYASINATNSLKQCLACPSGCSLCSGYSTCQAWDNQEAYVPNLWKDKMEFWILLIILLCGVIGYIIFKLVKKQSSSDLEENMMTKSDDKDSGEKEKKEDIINDIKISNESLPLPNDSLADSLGPTLDMKGGDTLWFNELVEMEPVEVKVRGRKRRAKEVDPLSMNNIDATSNIDL
jgi:hypothetical protein